MEFPSVCRECECSVELTDGIFHSPQFRAYFRYSEIDLSKFKIPTQSLVVYCLKCMFEIFYKQIAQKQCGWCGIRSATYLTRPDQYHTSLTELQDKSLCKHCFNHLIEEGLISQKVWNNDPSDESDEKTRTCLKCAKTGDNKQIDEEELKDEDPFCIRIQNCGILDRDGFPCTGEWILCENQIVQQQLGLNVIKYTITEDLTGFICKECFDTLEKELIAEVKCDYCSQRYVAQFPGSTDQGINCAGEATDGWIHCHYGSRYDDDHFIWKDMLRPDQYRHVKVICDNCISQLLKAGVIEESK